MSSKKLIFRIFLIIVHLLLFIASIVLAFLSIFLGMACDAGCSVIEEIFLLVIFFTTFSGPIIIVISAILAHRALSEEDYKKTIKIAFQLPAIYIVTILALIFLIYILSGKL